MFDHDFTSDMPTGGELFAEIGLAPKPVREVIEGDRTMRCPDRDTLLPVRRSAGFTTETPLECVLRQSPLPEILARPPATQAGGMEWEEGLREVNGRERGRKNPIPGRSLPIINIQTMKENRHGIRSQSLMHYVCTDKTSSPDHEDRSDLGD